MNEQVFVAILVSRAGNVTTSIYHDETWLREHAKRDNDIIVKMEQRSLNSLQTLTMGLHWSAIEKAKKEAQALYERQQSKVRIVAIHADDAHAWHKDWLGAVGWMRNADEIEGWINCTFEFEDEEKMGTHQPFFRKILVEKVK